MARKTRGSENSNSTFTTERYQKMYGNEIESLSTDGYFKIVEHIIGRDIWAAKESFKRMSLVEDNFVAEQSMSKVLCTLYESRSRNNNDRGRFYLSDYMSKQEIDEFLIELHSLRDYFIYKKESNIPTLGINSKVILDGLEDSQQEAA